ncbi:unnamed protein product [Rhizophagus irregularis]|nr:unnamed protein product [Rhizophagus irregularis]
MSIKEKRVKSDNNKSKRKGFLAGAAVAVLPVLLQQLLYLLPPIPFRCPSLGVVNFPFLALSFCESNKAPKSFSGEYGSDSFFSFCTLPEKFGIRNVPVLKKS